MFVCWAAKGGAGTTVIAAALALRVPHAWADLSDSPEPSRWLVDLGGDTPATLGIPEPAGPGVLDWMASGAAGVDHLAAMSTVVDSGVRLVHAGGSATGDRVSTSGLERLCAALPSLPGTVVIDAGPAPGSVDVARVAAASGAVSLLVQRPCYLALRRASSLPTPDGIIVVGEPGRALTSNDIRRAVGAPVVAEVPYDPAVARAVDAGLLVARLPRPLAHALRAVGTRPIAAVAS